MNGEQIAQAQALVKVGLQDAWCRLHTIESDYRALLRQGEIIRQEQHQDHQDRVRELLAEIQPMLQLQRSLMRGWGAQAPCEHDCLELLQERYVT